MLGGGALLLVIALLGAELQTTLISGDAAVLIVLIIAWDKDAIFAVLIRAIFLAGSSDTPGSIGAGDLHRLAPPNLPLPNLPVLCLPWPLALIGC